MPAPQWDKLRNRCTQCMWLNLKCDEAKPKCSRCVGHLLSCHYALRVLWFEKSQTPASGDSFQHESVDVDATATPKLPASMPQNELELQQQYPFSALTDTELYDFLLYQHDFNPQDAALLRHYLDHTRGTLSLCKEDLWAMRTGILTLASQNLCLMNALVSLAALCHCRHMVNNTHMPGARKWLEVRKYLSLADSYHEASIQMNQAMLINATTATRDNFSLAHATLASMFVAHAHSLRVRMLDLTYGPLDKNCTPTPFQWIGSFLKIHEVYKDLRRSPIDGGDPIPDQLPIGPTTTYPTDLGEGVYEAETQLLCNSMTFGQVESALVSLRARSLLAIEEPKNLDNEDLLDVMCRTVSLEFQVCLLAFGILESITGDIFQLRRGILTKYTRLFEPYEAEFDVPPESRLSQIKPWLRDFVDRLISPNDSKHYGKMLLSFVHRVPTEFWALVSEVVGHMDLPNDKNESPSKLNGQPEPIPTSTDVDVVNCFAVDIFAHWLGLVMLQDDIWWLKNIGASDLALVVSITMKIERFQSYRKPVRDWWPETTLKRCALGCRAACEQRFAGDQT